CYQTDRAKVEAVETVEIVIDEQQARLDLCEPCNQEFLDPVRALVQARAAAQPALDRSTGADNGDSRKPRSRPGPTARCGQCGATVQIRNRGAHARSQHDGANPEDLTWHFDDVEKIWACSCGLPFPTKHGRNTHIHRTGHTTPEEAVP